MLVRTTVGAACGAAGGHPCMWWVTVHLLGAHSTAGGPRTSLLATRTCRVASWYAICSQTPRS